MADLRLKTIIGLTDRLTGPLRRLSGRVAAATTRMSAVATRSAVPIAAGAGVATAALYKMTSGVAAANDELAKAARRTGITAQAYAELRHVANLSGVSAGEFAKGMERATRSIGEARVGTGALYAMLRKSNRGLLEQVQSAGSTAEAIDLLFESMARLEDPADRAAFAAAAFGRAGAKMALMTENGADALRDTRKEFERYFGVVDDDALKQSEGFVDTQARLDLAMAGLKNTIGNALIPVVEPLLKQFTEWASLNRELISSRVQDFARKLVTTLRSVPWGKVGDGIARVWNGLGRLVEMLGGIENVVPAVSTMLGVGLVGSLTSLLGPLGLVAGGIAAAVALWDDMPPAVRRAAAAVKRAMGPVIDTIGKAVDDALHLIDLLERQSRLEEYEDRIVRVSAVERFGKAVSAANPYQGSLGELFEAVSTGGASVRKKFERTFVDEQRKWIRARMATAPLGPQKGEVMVRVKLEGDGAERATVVRTESKSPLGLKVGVRTVGATP